MEKLVGFWNGQKIRKLWKIMMGLGTKFFVQLPLVAEKSKIQYFFSDFKQIKVHLEISTELLAQLQREPI